MELDRTKFTTFRREGTVRAVAEESIDAVIPDRLPDAERIVFSDAELTLSDTDDGSTVGGNARMTAVYLGDDGALHTISANLPFQTRLDNRSDDGKGIVRACVRSADARLVNSRKLSFRLAAVVTRERAVPFETELTLGARGGDGLCVREETEEIWTIPAAASRRFTVSDDLELPNGLPDAAELVSTTVRLREAEHKRVTGKLVAKCDAELETVYLTPDGALASARFTLPFSQILESDGVEEDSEVRLTLVPRGIETELAGEAPSRLLRATIRAEAYLLASERRELRYVSDAYGTKYDAVLDKTDIRAVTELSSGFGEIELRERIPCEVGAAELIALHASVLPPTVSPGADGKCAVIAAVPVKCVYAGSDGSVYGASKVLSAEWSAAADPDDELFARAELADASAVIENGAAAVKIKVDFASDAVKSRSISAVKSITNGEAVKREPDAPTFVLRSVHAGDGLFPLAKEYRTTLGELRRLNGIEGDSAPADGMLLIG